MMETDKDAVSTSQLMLTHVAEVRCGKGASCNITLERAAVKRMGTVWMPSIK